MLLISSWILLFALVSGAEENSLKGIIQNSMNAWPWALLLFLNFLSWKKPLLAGVLITLFGLVSTYFFSFDRGDFHPFVFTMTVGITLVGLLQSYFASQKSS